MAGSTVCSTVLLPSRIVQVLNLNVENMCSHLSLPSSFVHSTSYSGKSSLFESVSVCQGMNKYASKSYLDSAADFA